MDAIQRLRSKGHDNKSWLPPSSMKVSVQTQESRQAIVIESADPNTMYCRTTIRRRFTEPGLMRTINLLLRTRLIARASSRRVSPSVRAGPSDAWGNYWGGGANWGNRHLYVNHRQTTLEKLAAQRRASRGVRYNNVNVQQRFGNNNLKVGASNRMDFRGRDRQQVVRPGQDRPGGGDSRWRSRR